jgi:hypothetical protein
VTDTMLPSLTDEDRQALLRWRLALGPEAEKVNDTFGLDGLRLASGGVGVPDDRVRELDEILDFVYGQDRRGGSGASRPNIPRWLAGLREFFRHEVVSLVQKDAIEKKGLTQLLFEPETLPFLEKNVSLVTMLLSAKSLIPEKAKDLARDIVREVVDELRKKLETQMRTAVIGALRRDQTSPLKVLRNLDWRRTIRQNLQGWDTEHRRLVPRQMYFWANQRRHHEWDVAICVDQSGSMAESVVYSSVMAAIFASLDVLRTRLLFFDTEIVDVTPILVDPVEVLFSTTSTEQSPTRRSTSWSGPSAHCSCSSPTSSRAATRTSCSRGCGSWSRAGSRRSVCLRSPIAGGRRTTTTSRARSSRLACPASAAPPGYWPAWSSG